MAQESLDEVVVNNPFNLNAAIESLRFYWNLARHKGQTVTMEIWAEKDAVIPERVTAVSRVNGGEH